jgi:uncharacterized protein
MVSTFFEGSMGFEASQDMASVAAALQAALIYVALLALLGFSLSIPVMLQRRKAHIGLGDGGDKELLRRMRIHGNFIEQATLGLPLLIGLPLAGAPLLIVHLCGAALLLGRLFHAQGLTRSFGISFGRTVGMLLSWSSLIGGAGLLIVYTLSTGTVFRLLGQA